MQKNRRGRPRNNSSPIGLYLIEPLHEAIVLLAQGQGRSRSGVLSKILEQARSQGLSPVDYSPEPTLKINFRIGDKSRRWIESISDEREQTLSRTVNQILSAAIQSGLLEANHDSTTD